MASKIKSITALNLQGSHCYDVGEEYNGLVVDRIEDNSIEHPDAVTVIYMGFTKDDDIVFELINAPVDVEYEEVSGDTE